jgi:hypothetical protein
MIGRFAKIRIGGRKTVAFDQKLERKRRLEKRRSKRYRSRQATDEFVLPVRLHSDFVTWAIEARYVGEDKSWDRAQLAAAVSKIVAAAMVASRVTLDSEAEAVKPVSNQITLNRGTLNVQAEKAGSDDR